MRARVLGLGLVGALSSVGGCSGVPVDTAESVAAVVGGRTETGYPPVGYMMIGRGGGALKGPYCGATLIAPNLAVTAAHCVHDESASTRWGIGFGAVRSGAANPARAVIENPGYDPNATPRYRHDVAVLVLDPPVTTVTPARVARASLGGATRYIGYGRTTPGDYNVTTGYTDERKSAAQRLSSDDGWSLWTAGIDGGLCWGDSGGPLVTEGGGDVLGVLSDFDQIFDCQVGNGMIFTSLDGERAFLNKVAGCAGDDDPVGCVQN